jgi:omega-amidase
MKVALVQTNLVWENAEANLNNFSVLLSSIEEGTDMVVLPEMCTTGFSMQPQQFATHTPNAIEFFENQAKQNRVAIACSMMTEEQGKYYNRFYFFHPDGKIDTYDKRHLFSVGNEHQHYTSGKQQIVIQYKGWRIMPAVCYDLRFPVWLRRTPSHDYDMLLIVANWPEKRSYHWRQLLIARAIENQTVVVACNRVGDDAHQIAHIGLSAIINAKGEVQKEVANDSQTIYATLDITEISAWRSQFAAINDADNFDFSH